MSEIEFRLREIERRVGKVEDATAAVPVMQRDITAIASDSAETKDEVRSLRRALYTTALSIMAGAVMFAFSVFELIR